jgi:hypothetical protein
MKKRFSRKITLKPFFFFKFEGGLGAFFNYFIPLPYFEEICWAFLVLDKS